MTPARPQLSVVMPAHNEGAWLRSSVTAIFEHATVPLEVLVIDDQSTDHSCDFLRTDADEFPNVSLARQERRGVAGARNHGARIARADKLLFLDAHCFPHAGSIELMLETACAHPQAILTASISSFQDPRRTGYGLTLTGRLFDYTWLSQQDSTPYPIPIAGGACMMMSKTFFETLGQFDAMRWIGIEDVELCLRCWLFGHSVILEPRATVRHVFKQPESVPARRESYAYNALRTAILHCDGDRLQTLLSELRTTPGFAGLSTSLVRSDIFQRYFFVRTNRTRDFDWFTTKFHLSIGAPLTAR